MDDVQPVEREVDAGFPAEAGGGGRQDQWGIGLVEGPFGRDQSDSLGFGRRLIGGGQQLRDSRRGSSFAISLDRALLEPEQLGRSSVLEAEQLVAALAGQSRNVFEGARVGGDQMQDLAGLEAIEN